MGFDFTIEYKGGKENIASDTLSGREEQGDEEAQILAISCRIPNWIDSIKEDTSSNPDMGKIVQRVLNGEALGPWKYRDGILFFKERIYLTKDSPMIKDIIEQFHNSTHEGFLKTFHRNTPLFISKGLRLKYISMDFIDGLPISRGKSTIFVVVDRLSKYAHFVPISHPYATATISQIFFENIFWLDECQNLLFYCYNTNIHSTIGKTPFKVVYGRPPLTILSYIPRKTKVTLVEQELMKRNIMIKELKEKIQQKIGLVVYKLELPRDAKVHPVFYVSLLKKKIGAKFTMQPQFPFTDEVGMLSPQPEAILDSRVRRKKHEILVHWRGLSPA
ncbi:hypothetical protein K2173_018849 [Erythroxylum novogranatense]|uniref:Tf2-1-like SH3-like domain-containing protein n=1 Tax=Erythroxylum novogranatense TaxID=1862640 RepID=A0AAV8T3D1_9ROSI|nr:hypothetical protein K2173_018849 [Erythroxylum novogranatense]